MTGGSETTGRRLVVRTSVTGGGLRYRPDAAGTPSLSSAGAASVSNLLDCLRTEIVRDARLSASGKAALTSAHHASPFFG
jgi:hypothetical protein